MRTFFAYLGLGKIIGVLGVTFIMISYLYIKQQRQYYPIGENLSITIWHEYIIFSHYTSFFPPTSYDEYIYLPSHPKYVHICFIDSADFILYTSNEGNTIVSTKYYNLNKYYCGSGIQYYNFIKYLQQDFFTKEPLCEIELDRERGVYLPYINTFADSTYYRVAYEYSDIFMHKKDSTIYNMPLQMRLESIEKEIKKWETVIIPNCHNE